MITHVDCPAVNCGDKSYNTNSPIASPLTVVRIHVPRILAVATIRGRQLFKDGVYLKKYGTCVCDSSD